MNSLSRIVLLCIAPLLTGASFGVPSGGRGGPSGEGIDGHVVRWDGTSALTSTDIVVDSDGVVHETDSSFLWYRYTSTASPNGFIEVDYNAAGGALIYLEDTDLDPQVRFGYQGASISGTFLGMVRDNSATMEVKGVDVTIGTSTAHPLYFGTSDTVRLTIGATGTATFSTSIVFDGVTTDITSGTNQSIAIVPDGAGELLLGSTTDSGAYDVQVNGDLYVSSSATVASINNIGNTTLGNASSDTINFSGRVNSDIVPQTDNTHALGTSGFRWGTAYVVGINASGNAVIAGVTTLGDANTDTTQIYGPMSNPGAGTPTGCNNAGYVCVNDGMNVSGDFNVAGSSLQLGGLASTTVYLIGPVSNNNASAATGCTTAGALCIADTLESSGAVLIPNGSNAAPSLAFTSDADGSGTGIYRSNANEIAFSTNGSQRATIGTGSITFGLGLVFSSVATDITTGTNEDLTLLANGTGSTRIGSGDNVIEFTDSSGNVEGNITTTAGATADWSFGASNGSGRLAFNGNFFALGSGGDRNATSSTACFSDGVNAGGTSATHLFCVYGAGKTATQITQVASCTDSGDGSPAALTFDPQSDYVQVTNADPDGCVITISETSAIARSSVVFVVRTNVGGVVTFPDVGGVHNGPTCATTTGLALDDTYSILYQGSDNYYVGLGCSDN